MSVLLLESLHPDAEALLQAEHEVVRAAEPNAPDGHAAALRGDFAAVRAILTRGRGRIEQPLLERCPNLRAVARCGVGLDNLDTKTARRMGIPVVFAPGGNAATVAEHTLALLLDLARGITRQALQVRGGGWEQRARYQGSELRGLTLGVLGFGNIGQRVAKLASAFGMRVLALSRRPVAAPFVAAELPQILADSDALTLHLPLTDATRGLLGAEQFAAMKPGVLLVNTARGALIDGAALRQAVRSGHLGGFAADVLEQEPPADDDELLRSERVVLTPHTASLTGLTYRELCVSTARNVLAILRGEQPEPHSIFGG